MEKDQTSRREFLRTSAAACSGAALLASSPRPSAAAPADGNPATRPAGASRRTAADQVPLGRTGITLSRLGLGTGSNNGQVQLADGPEHFRRLVHACFERGITYLDCAESYATFPLLAGAIAGLPREKLFIQSKIDGRPADILARIDHHRSTFKTDYVDSMLVHCMTAGNWTDDWKRVMEGFDKAKDKQWVRAKGVSCHSLPALQAANRDEWAEVHLVRVNPQGMFMDGPTGAWHARPEPVPIDPVLAEIRSMHEKGRGVIGMKIYGNGTFTDPADRERSVRFAMSRPDVHAVVIGMKNEQEVDEAIGRVNRALAESA